MKTLILMRHVPGAGSSTFAEEIAEICYYSRIQCLIAAADQFFERDGEYKWDATKLKQAHKECLEKVDNAMYFKVPIVIVTNTFVTEREVKPYIEAAQKYGYKVVSLAVENRHGSKDIHNVPEEKRKEQEQRLRSSLKLL